MLLYESAGTPLWLTVRPVPSALTTVCYEPSCIPLITIKPAKCIRRAKNENTSHVSNPLPYIYFSRRDQNMMKYLAKSVLSKRLQLMTSLDKSYSHYSVTQLKTGEIKDVKKCELRDKMLL